MTTTTHTATDKTARPLTLLAIYAHPDDESFGAGGTLARYASEGIDVHIAIATDGASGTADASFLEGYESLAARRRDELALAVRELGATLHTLPYRDSGMEGSADNDDPSSLYQAPLGEVACHVVGLFQRVRPHVVMTHGPTGEYFHPDHIKVHRAVIEAWALSAGPNACGESEVAAWQPERLFWNAISDRWIKRFVRLLILFRKDPTRMGRNQDIDLTHLGMPEAEITTTIDVRDHLATKQRASRAHASQGGGDPLSKHMPRVIQRVLFGTERYVQGWPEAPLQKDDFFAGLSQVTGPSKVPVTFDHDRTSHIEPRRVRHERHRPTRQPTEHH